MVAGDRRQGEHGEREHAASSGEASAQLARGPRGSSVRGRAAKALAIGSGVALVAAGTAFAVTGGSPPKGTRHKGKGSVVTAVEVARATAGTAISALSLSGTVAATSSLPLAPGVAGRVAAIDVVAGQSVRAGQVLVSLANPVLQAQLAEARAAVATAQAKLAAAEAPPTAQALAVAQDGVAKAQASLAAAEQAYQQAVLAAHQASPARSGTTTTTTQAKAPGSAADVSAAEAAVASAQAAFNLAEAEAAAASAPPSAASLQPLVSAVTQAQAAEAVVQANLAEESLRAPFAGTVASLAATAGELVGAGTTVLTLNGAALSVQAPVSQADLPLLRAGDPATLSILGGGTTLPARVTALSPVADPSALTFQVTLTPTSDPPWLHPGEAAVVSVVTARTANAVLVPASAIVTINGTPQVFVVGPPATAKAGAASATASTTRPHRHTHKHKGAKHKARKGGAAGSAARGARTITLVSVRPSISDGTTTEVSRLAPGATVVVSGQTYLGPGDLVRVSGTVAVPSSVTGSSVGGLLTAPPPTTGGAKPAAPGAGLGAGSAATGGAGKAKGGKGA